jgi:hypothetical protein
VKRERKKSGGKKKFASIIIGARKKIDLVSQRKKVEF